MINILVPPWQALFGELYIGSMNVGSNLGEATGAQVLQQESTRMPDRSVPARGKVEKVSSTLDISSKVFFPPEPGRRQLRTRQTAEVLRKNYKSLSNVFRHSA